MAMLAMGNGTIQVDYTKTKEVNREYHTHYKQVVTKKEAIDIFTKYVEMHDARNDEEAIRVWFCHSTKVTPESDGWVKKVRSYMEESK